MSLNGRWGRGLALLLVGTVVALGMACGGGGGDDGVSGTITGIKISGDLGICGGTYSYIVFTAEGDEDDTGVVLILIAASDVTALFSDSSGENTAVGTISGNTMTLGFTLEEGGTVTVVLVCADDGASFSGNWTETGGAGEPVPDPTTPSTPSPTTPSTPSPTTPSTPSPTTPSAPASSTFAGSMSGTWSGTCSGFPASGSFSFTIAADGSVSGSYSGDDSGSVSGSVSGTGSFTVGGAAGSSTWVGEITRAGDTLSGSGLWSDPDCSGTWSGSGPAA